MIKNVNVNEDKYLEILIDQVLPAIHDKYPNLEQTLHTQHDNPGPQIHPQHETSAIEMSIIAAPDLNINNLHLFA